MNQRLTYEQTIAEKLELIPIPEMEHAIWKRIESQLDIDMPGDGGTEPAGSPHFPKPGPLLLGAGSIVFLTALLLYFVIKNKDHTTTQKYLNPATTPIMSPRQQQKPRPLERNIPLPPLPIKQGATTSVKQVDSNMYTQPPVLLPDSNALIKDRGDVIIIPPEASHKDNEPVKKKKRGVTGLTDEDYHIAPKGKNDLP